MRLYQKFASGVPDYLARYYWWAYLWPWGIWLFDRQFTINAILFGQYDKLLHKTQRLVETSADARLLQLTCVYGKLTPSLLDICEGDLHLCDVADAQLQLTRSKTSQLVGRCRLTRMNAERMGYANDAFDQVIVFFLLHEMPDGARRRTYAEIARVVRIGGSVLITEYASTPHLHLLYRFTPFRWLIGKLEPFLPGFWQEDVAASLVDALHENGKALNGDPHTEHVFAGYYRVMRFNICNQN
ncbi:MAG: methyltransferase domain-containing protein [Gallionella sp.]|jgi:ubiquinone/menaquinone biosynthesis C-methylase UbiE